MLFFPFGMFISVYMCVAARDRHHMHYHHHLPDRHFHGRLRRRLLQDVRLR